MKKTLLITAILAGLLILVLASSFVTAASPADTTPFCRWATMTDGQKEELAPLRGQMTDLRKQMFEVRQQIIQKQVEFGNLTQEQADQCISRMQQRIDQGFAGPGRMGGGQGCQGYGRGCSGYGPGSKWQ
jgi:hypothetical protein